MGVRVDHAGDHDPAGEIQHLRRRSAQEQRLARRADERHAAAADGHRLHERMRIVDGVDLCVDENQVSREQAPGAWRWARAALAAPRTKSATAARRRTTIISDDLIEEGNGGRTGAPDNVCQRPERRPGRRLAGDRCCSSVGRVYDVLPMRAPEVTGRRTWASFGSLCATHPPDEGSLARTRPLGPDRAGSHATTACRLRSTTCATTSRIRARTRHTASWTSP